MAEKCTNTSADPSSGVRNPYPFVALNHFTVPSAIVVPSFLHASTSNLRRHDGQPTTTTGLREPPDAPTSVAHPDVDATCARRRSRRAITTDCSAVQSTCGHRRRLHASSVRNRRSRCSVCRPWRVEGRPKAPLDDNPAGKGTGPSYLAGWDDSPAEEHGG